MAPTLKLPTSLFKNSSPKRTLAPSKSTISLIVGLFKLEINGIAFTITSIGRLPLKPSVTNLMFSGWTLFAITARTSTSRTLNESYTK